jgi:acyl carrier protein
MMEVCTICREADASGGRAAGDVSFCPTCGMLFRWFLDHYADVEFREAGWITPETTFHELSIESLDYVQWLLEAEERFGVTIAERDADEMRTVGDYLRYIRLHGTVKGHKPTPGSQDPLWDWGLDK